MIRSKRVFKVENGSLQNLKLHVAARAEIVAFAKAKSFKFGTGQPQMNPDYWNVPLNERAQPKVPKGQSAFDAFGDITAAGDKYCVACKLGTSLTMAGGIANAMGRQAFDKAYDKKIRGGIYDLVTGFLREDRSVPRGDWIPGDWGYITNTKFSLTKNQQGEEGENIIYAGDTSWWGHLDAPAFDTLENWEAAVEGWGAARLEASRLRPRLGLTN